ncbi:ligase-associated DNA damage response endonuclease PdeM [Ruixingdingia sedimenti]|uniref:Ligase-associated DNA damage response endonuclease PdeM n=1 Tax=Ruixingdingia sedimenti TaxID=3073604 RepID=A0ABU1FC24_9RHOB|nr:ligase-associated DNA damage response endonuclease PdeM [Xinfangfangia sp. LG-4]MDR5654451.1 ligase-associated DNA damage response endonuclease PdeM [Xinfangfangia sp. LG-4]
MTGHAFPFHGEILTARASGALWWAAAGVLVVADLHFGKALRPARRGGALLPPYDMAETLARLDAELDATGARRVIALGDSFDAPGAEAELAEPDRLWLARLMAGRDWIWIAGNHDPGPADVGGSLHGAYRLGPLIFRHIAEPGAVAEVSGHYHPKARLAAGAAPCFLIDAARVILPAFGRYTGGLDCRADVLAGLMGPGALAVLTGRRARLVPMPR